MGREMDGGRKSTCLTIQSAKESMSMGTEMESFWFKKMKKNLSGLLRMTYIMAKGNLSHQIQYMRDIS
jgi:hypothetical protein